MIIENKSGRSAIAVKSVVDATGDADVCHLAGEDTALFGQGNVLAGWYYHTADGVHALRMSAASDIPDKYKSPERLEADKSRKRYSGIDGDEISRYMQDSHASTLASFLKSGNYDYKKHALSTITAIPQLRMTRRVAGVYTQDDTETFREYADSVGMFSDWRNRGPVYELPFGTLHGRKIRNLIAAGRCISGTDAMWDITRVIPVCAVSGEAAGTAAAMTNDIPHIDITELQRRLRNAGVKIHISDLESIMEGNT